MEKSINREEFLREQAELKKTLLEATKALEELKKPAPIEPILSVSEDGGEFKIDLPQETGEETLAGLGLKNGQAVTISKGSYMGKSGRIGKIDKGGNLILENFEEREQVLTLLQDFYQERQKNTPVHKEIWELAEKMRELLGKANLLIDKVYGSESETGEEYISISRKNSLKIGRIEIVQKWKQGDKNGVTEVLRAIEELEKILGGSFEKKPTTEEEKQLSELIENLKETDNKINEDVEKLWEIRKNIAKELILIIPELKDFKDAKFKEFWENEELYNLNGCLQVSKKFETIEGVTTKTVEFDLQFSSMLEMVVSLIKKNNITDHELMEIQDLKWSAEEKENLKNLMEDVNEYKAEAEKLKEGLLKSANLKFKNEGANLVKDEFTRAFIRQSYEDYKLPVSHQERVVQEIMNGAFSF